MSKNVSGEYRVEHLRPIPAKMGEFLPLWHARNAHSEGFDLMKAQLEGLDLDEEPDRATELVEGCKLHLEEVDRLTVAMRPLQELVGEPETFSNLVTTVGKNDFLDKYLKGSAYTQTVRMGLAGTGTKAAADTQSSHAGWTERGLANAPAYTGNRKDVVMGSAAAGVSTSPTQAFAITSSGTVDGCFINNGGSATKDDTTGVLFSAGDFAAPKTVANLDTLNVVYTLTAA